MAKRTPSGNIEWNKLPASACVEDRGKLYVAHWGRKKAVIFWGSQDAKQAQASLWARSRSAKNERCVRDIKAGRDPLPGLSGARRRRKQRK